MANRRYSCIGLFNPKSPENVGSVMRAAGCYGVNSVFYTGKRYARAQEFATDTKMIHQDIPLIGIDDLQKIIPLGCTPVAVELIEGARPLPEYTHPDRAIYIFGPEDGSLGKDVLEWCEERWSSWSSQRELRSSSSYQTWLSSLPAHSQSVGGPTRPRERPDSD